MSTSFTEGEKREICLLPVHDSEVFVFLDNLYDIKECVPLLPTLTIVDQICHCEEEEEEEGGGRRRKRRRRREEGGGGREGELKGMG